MAEAVDTPAPRPYRRRFLIGFAVLGALVVGAVTTALVVGLGSAAKDSPPWSSWKPNKGGVEGAQQIADHVAPLYKLNEGKQLVAVRAGEAQVAGYPLNIVISLNGGQDYKLVRGKALIYVLCGLGDRCSIRSGAPSVNRSLLLRRESLELALYTFHYMPNIDSVVALLPPRPGEDPSIAMLYQRTGLSSELHTPLTRTLTAKPPKPSGMKKKDVFTITRLTNSRLFQYSVQPGQDGTAFLVLDPS
jgi:hypothetical protein